MLLPIAWAAVSCSWLAHLDHALAGDSALFIYLSNYLFVYLFIFFLSASLTDSFGCFSALLLTCWSIWRAELGMESLQLFSHEMMCSFS